MDPDPLAHVSASKGFFASHCGFDRKRPRAINPFLSCCYLYIFACYKTIDSLEILVYYLFYLLPRKPDPEVKPDEASLPFEKHQPAVPPPPALLESYMIFIFLN